MDKTNFGLGMGKKQLRTGGFIFYVRSFLNVGPERGEGIREEGQRDPGLEKEAMKYRTGSWTFPHVNCLLGAPVSVEACNCSVKASNIN